MVDGIALTPDLFARLSRTIRFVESLMGRGGVLDGHHVAPLATFLNDTGETIPPYGIFWVEDDPDVDDQIFPIVTAKKPSTTFAPCLYVNGENEVEDGSLGQYQLGSEIYLAYDSGTPAVNDGYGAKPSQFTASINYPCQFISKGVIDATNKIMLARNLFAIQSLIGKPASDIAAGASGTFNIYSGTSGSEAIISSMTVTVRAKGPAMAAADFGTAGIINGQWYGFPYECGS